MQRDVKIGIVIGVLLIALIGIFMWMRSGDQYQRPADQQGGPALLPPPQEPVAPIGIEPETGPAQPPGVAGSPTPGYEAPMPAGPATPAPAQPPTSPIAPRYHTVKAGDTLTKIAATYYGSGVKSKRDLIYQANRSLMGDNPNYLKVGWKLVIPQPAGSDRLREVSISVPPARSDETRRTHIVSKGDTLTKISQKYYGSGAKSKRDLIFKANRSLMGDDPDLLKVGWKLVIPSDE